MARSDGSRRDPAVATERRRRWRRRLVVGLVALIVRGGLALIQPRWPAVSDGVDYERIAGFLLEGRGFGGSPAIHTSHRPPLQPCYRAAVRGAFGDAPGIAEVAQAAVAAPGVVAAAEIAAALGGPAAGWVAGLGLAMYPAHVDAALRFWSLSENLFMSLLLVALAFLTRAERPRRPLLLVAAGVALGLAVLARPVALVYPLVAVLAARRRLGFSGAVVVLSAALLTIAPWTLRNAVVQHAFVPVSTMTGVVLWQGVHPSPQGFGFVPWEEMRSRAIAGGAYDSEVAMDRYLTRAALVDACSAPARTIKLVALKLLWLVNPWSGEDRALDPAYLLALGLGLLALGRRGALGLAGRDAPLVAFLVYVVLAAAVFYGSPRLRLPAEPVLVVYAAVWVVEGSRLKGFFLATAGVVVTAATLWGLGDSVREGVKALVERVVGALGSLT